MANPHYEYLSDIPEAEILANKGPSKLHPDRICVITRDATKHFVLPGARGGEGKKAKEPKESR